ncbi:MAG: MarR family winged helix-turn-helix transcriptional regulator [Acutalibacteraceae bacterium]
MENSIGLTIKELNNLISKKSYILFTEAVHDKISYSGFQVMEYLYNHADCRVLQRDVERLIGCTRVTASKLLNRLERKGYLQRTVCALDERQREVSLTPLGEQLYRQSIPAVRHLDNVLAQALSEADCEALQRISEKIKKVMER